MRRIIFVVAAVLFMLCAVNATASMITFVETGTASGNYYGTEFTNLPFTITATADTEKRYWDPWLGDPRGWEVNCATTSIAIGDFLPVATAPESTQLMVLNDVKSILFNFTGREAGIMIIGPYADAFGTWDLTTSLGPISGYGRGDIRLPPFSNLGQSLYLTIDGPITFAATVRDPAAVPEPGTLALVGAGVFALAVYRKRTKKA